MPRWQDSQQSIYLRRARSGSVPTQEFVQSRAHIFGGLCCGGVFRHEFRFALLQRVEGLLKVVEIALAAGLFDCGSDGRFSLRSSRVIELIFQRGHLRAGVFEWFFYRRKPLPDAAQFAVDCFQDFRCAGFGGFDLLLQRLRVRGFPELFLRRRLRRFHTFQIAGVCLHKAPLISLPWPVAPDFGVERPGEGQDQEDGGDHDRAAQRVADNGIGFALGRRRSVLRHRNQQR
jgi:hypothetical protein